MKNLKLRVKFVLIVVPVLILVVALSILINSTAKGIKNSTEEVLYDQLYTASSNLINADRDFYQAYVSMILSAFNAGDPVELQADKDENYQQTYDRVAAAVESIKTDDSLYKEYTLDALLAMNGKTPEKSANSGKTVETLYKEFVKFLEAWNVAIDQAEGIMNFDEARARLNVMEDILDEHATVELKEIDEELNSQLTAIIAVVIIVGLVVAALMVYVVLYIVRGIGKVNESLIELSNNNLAFEPAKLEGKDELAEMSRGIVAVQESLAVAISSVNSAAEVLAANIATVSDGSVRSSEGIETIDYAINEVSTTSQQVANSAILLNEKSIEMSENIASITKSIGELHDASAQIDSVNKEATSSMAEVMKSSELSVEAVNDITSQIRDTNEAVSRIVECIQVITDISSQTNLLSLNASIEAARAGDAGRGFAVVAEEIRTLADSCAKSAEEIRDIVNAVTAISGKTVASAKHVSEVIDKQQEDLRYTQNKFAELTVAVEKNMQGINSIESMAKGLEVVKNELSDSTSTLSAISEELGASAEDVTATCSQVAADCSATKNMAVEMSQTKDQLIDAVSVFNI